MSPYRRIINPDVKADSMKRVGCISKPCGISYNYGLLPTPKPPPRFQRPEIDSGIIIDSKLLRNIVGGTGAQPPCRASWGLRFA